MLWFICGFFICWFLLYVIAITVANLNLVKDIDSFTSMLLVGPFIPMHLTIKFIYNKYRKKTL